MTKTLGEKLIELKDRSGLSFANIAKAGGFRGGSSIQRYFSPEFDREYLPSHLAKKFVEALVGFGDPPITRHDIEALTEIGFMQLRQPSPTINIDRAEKRFIDCVGSYVSTAPYTPWEGLMLGRDALRHFRAPEHLYYRPIDAFFMDGTSMLPRIRPGEVVFYESERPAQIGNDVVVFLSSDEDNLPTIIVGQLLARKKDCIVLSHGASGEGSELPNSTIDYVAPILPTSELLEQVSRREAYAK